MEDSHPWALVEAIKTIVEAIGMEEAMEMEHNITMEEDMGEKVSPGLATEGQMLSRTWLKM